MRADYAYRAVSGIAAGDAETINKLPLLQLELFSVPLGGSGFVRSYFAPPEPEDETNLRMQQLLEDGTIL